MKKLRLTLLLAIMAAFVWATTAFATDVPRGGVDISVAGTNSPSLSLTNKTKMTANDVTVTLQLAGNVKITAMDDPGAAGDKIDDNNNGTIDGGETDNNQNPAATTSRSIFTNYTVADNGTITLNISLDAVAPAGATVKVRFSYKSNDNKHYDLCALDAIGTDKSATMGIPFGTHLANIAAIDSTGATQPVIRIYYQPSGSNSNDTIVSITVEPPYQASTVTREGPTNRKIALTSFDVGDTVLISVQLSGLAGDNNSKFSVTASGNYPTPFLGTRGIIVLLLLLAATAWFVLSRRKVRTTGSAA